MLYRQAALTFLMFSALLGFTQPPPALGMRW
jgi:hypothetical protein